MFVGIGAEVITASLMMEQMRLSEQLKRDREAIYQNELLARELDREYKHRHSFEAETRVVEDVPLVPLKPKTRWAD